MKLCEVVGKVVSTIKKSDLKDHSMLLVRQVGDKECEEFVALDLVGAGEDQIVLVTFGTSARVATGNPSSSTDAAVVGIVDESNSKFK